MLRKLLLAFSLCESILAQCPGSPAPVNSIKPVANAGWTWSVVSSNITGARGIQFDTQGRLVVIQSGIGITALKLEDDGGKCIRESSRKTLVADTSLNHGLQISPDGQTLYASSSEAASSWPYDSATGSIGKTPTVLVKGMRNNDHSTRTLQLSAFASNTLIVSRGSNANIDPGAADINAGRSQIKSFDLSKVPDGGYDFPSQGKRLGWGLRNSVGVAEHPVSGGIYAVENSCDDFTRDGVDVHNSNPGEEMNFLGTLVDNEFDGQGGTYGYPDCFAAWDPSTLPANDGLKRGSSFTNSSDLDYLCKNVIEPVITFGSHKAPLDLKFNNSGTEGWVSFHGSWDSDTKVGYKVGFVPFVKNLPTEFHGPNPTHDVFVNKDVTVCPENCFRPAGLVFDKLGRLFVSSDYSGEIYVVVRDDGATGSTNE